MIIQTRQKGQKSNAGVSAEREDASEDEQHCAE